MRKYKVPAMQKVYNIFMNGSLAEFLTKHTVMYNVIFDAGFNNKPCPGYVARNTIGWAIYMAGKDRRKLENKK